MRSLVNVPQLLRSNVLFSSEDLGDRKPSQLLRHMQPLLGDKAANADQFFLFLQRLLPNVRMFLPSTKDDEDLESPNSL